MEMDKLAGILPILLAGFGKKGDTGMNAMKSYHATTTSGMIKLFDGTLMPNGQSSMSSFTEWSDFESAVPDPYPDCYYEILTPIDMLFDTTIRVWSLIQSTIHPLDLTGVADPHADIDYRLAAGSYDSFAQWSLGIINARYIKLRIHIVTSTGIPIISGMKNTADAIERSEQDSSVVVGASGLTISFGTQFHLAPFIDIDIFGTTALTHTFEFITATQFRIHIFNSAGTEVGGTINWKATGV